MVFPQRSAFVPFSLNGGRDGLRQQVSAAPSSLRGSPVSSEYLLLAPRSWCPSRRGVAPRTARGLEPKWLRRAISLSLLLACLLGSRSSQAGPAPKAPPPSLWLKRVKALGSDGLVFSPVVGTNGSRRLLQSPNPEHYCASRPRPCALYGKSLVPAATGCPKTRKSRGFHQLSDKK